MKLFVTVGTHEQPFNRLIQYIDDKFSKEDVFMQIGYSTYIPKNSAYSKMISGEEMKQHIINADIVITHGGPASILDALGLGKVPIVVPRQKKYGEHVNDHQVDFSKVMEKNNKIIMALDIDGLENLILNYRNVIEQVPHNFVSNTDNFTKQFEIEVNRLFERKYKK